MKKHGKNKIRNRLLVNIILLLFCSCSLKTEVCEVLSISKEMTDKVIAPLYDELMSTYDKSKSVIVLRLSEDGEYQIRIAILYKDDFKWYLKDKKDKLFGYTRYKEVPVLVFGDESCESFYKKTGKVTKIEYLKILKNETDKNKSDLEMTPEIFEPVVTYYSVNESYFQLSDKGHLILLE